MSDSTALQTLKESLGDRVRTDPESLYRNSFDGMRLAFTHEADIQIDAPEQVGEVLRLANRHRVPVTTRGAGSSLTGSASPAQGGWVLLLDQLKDLRIDPLNRFAHAQPGVIVNELQDAARKEGLFYPPDPSSLRYCTIGGNIACNAGGMRCLKYGVTRDYVVALRGYLPTGEFVSWGSGTKKFATGYNMRDLWIGSEGTLGVVTGATLRLIPAPEAVWSLLAAFPAERAALDAVASVIGKRIGPSVLEFLDRPSVRGAEAAFGKPIFDGMPGRSLLLIQLDGTESEVCEAKEKLLAWAQEEAEAFRPAPRPEEAEELWNIRRACSGAMFELGDSKLNEDVVVPLDRQADLIDEVERIRGKHKVSIAVFGHAGDGNLHVNIMHHREDREESRRAREALGELMQSVVNLNGAISGEHGVGLAKSPFLTLQLSDAEIRAMRRVKDALDPNGILNPGKIFDPYEVWDKQKEVYRFPLGSPLSPMLTFVLRKLVASLLYPPTLSLLVAFVGFYLILRGRFVRTGKTLVGLGLMALLLLSIPALQQPILRSFEPRPVTSYPNDVSAIVVLGGGVYVWETPAPATSRLGATSLARAAEGIRLAREIPQIPLIFTGGRIGDRPASSEAMAALARAFGIPEDRILTFDTPTSTEEEAKRTAEELGAGEIILVTSALHLPRAQALFSREGLSVTPVPTDFLSDDSPPDFLDLLPSAGAWLNWQKLFHEIYGRLWAGLPIR